MQTEYFKIKNEIAWANIEQWKRHSNVQQGYCINYTNVIIAAFTASRTNYGCRVAGKVFDLFKISDSDFL